MDKVVECDCIFGYREVANRFSVEGKIKVIKEMRNCMFCNGTGYLTPMEAYRKMIECDRFCICEDVGDNLIYYLPSYMRFDCLMLGNIELAREPTEAHYKHGACGKIYAVRR